MLTDFIRRTPEYKRLLAAVQGAGPKGAVALFGLAPAARVSIVSALCADTHRPALVITAGEAEATRFAADSTTLGLRAAVYPARDFMFRNIEGQSREYEYRRLQVLGNLVGERMQLVCATVEGLLQSTLPKEAFLAGTRTIKEGETLPQAELLAALFAAGYSRRDQVEGPGQFSARGDIVDIFAPDMQTPARLEYWGDEIETMHTFDLLSQRRDARLQKIYLSPAREVLFGEPQAAAALLRNALQSYKGAAQKQLSAVMQNDLTTLDAQLVPEGLDKYLPLRYPKAGHLLDYMQNPLVFLDEPSSIREEGRAVQARLAQQQESLLEEGILSGALTGYYEQVDTLLHRLLQHDTIYAENFARSLPDVTLTETVNLPAHGLPPWPGDVATLVEEIRPLLRQGYYCAIMAGTPRSAKALAHDLDAAGIAAAYAAKPADARCAAGGVTVMHGRLSAGAEFSSAHFALFTSHRHDVARQQKKKKNKDAISSLSEIKPGDFVVHQNHGIGVYAGIQRLDLHGVVKDYLKISYDKADTLYVPVTQLDLLSRYTAPGDGEKVKLSKLGGEQWAKTKARVRVATSEMAKDLIALYARRRQAKGFAFAPDTEWQRDFEARFEYDETPDQITSTAEIKKDMEKPYPMDRLLCGDVGVGKTEVALRAAFKAVMDGKQVAILVPTTLLAWQHYHTMLARMEAFPVKIEMLSRFRTTKQKNEIIKGLHSGTIDIVVGTHSLLQKSVRFKDLGLVIVDEEQRFGVRHKEKLKETFIGVDMLTLSATPIPRTLNMAISGIRDLSAIDDPPTERQPVETYVMEHDDGVIVSAIQRELARAGQVYYIHNRIESIDYTASKLAQLLPQASIAIAHGRMSEEELSRVWQSLLDGETDILVCTTLIETGVDVRNCNTLIIEDADRMGLAQLYQIRGRVGRSARKAYAYFTFRRDKVLTEVAAKRLSAIREFTAFGSGFRIAMRDLQIRGAGNLLGQSQSGHMEAVGYDLYVKMLNQAVALARGEQPAPDKADTLIDITVDAYIPDAYIPDAPGRIEAYKKIAAIAGPEDAEDVLDELSDRYGPLTASVKGLVDISLLRVTAAQLGIYEITQQRDTLLIYSDKIDFGAVRPKLRDLSGRVLVNSSTKPYVSVRIASNEKPLALLVQVVEALQQALAPAKKAK